MINNSTIRKWALQNALKYSGKANPGAVIGKLLAEQPELKANMKEVAMQVNAVIKEISKLSPEQQLTELQQTAPELLEEKKKEEPKHSLPPLKNAVQGKVITAFPPEPSGVAHIGHASGSLFNMMYAQQYEGKFILRFEDTNPELAKLEFYQAITELLQWLGITWDKIVRISDTMQEMYSEAEKLIISGALYTCDCPVELMRDRRGTGEACLHRNKTPKENLATWKLMISGSEEKGIVLRYKGDLNSQNAVMRDPTMFRIIKTPHCIHGTRFVVWPSYDFAAAYSDGVEGITHRVRGKEFELRTELQSELQRLM
ncbi:MAG: glutamate--tRNA ligase family protein, partial [Candidatus Woesearchaeota archaeon]|nr:glutamate--tRNA ligase family protein [Candidatus Woesearchaeota archaeon]